MNSKNRLTAKQKKIYTSIILGLTVIFTAVICIFVGGPLIKFVENPEKFRNWVNSHGALGKLSFISMVVFQVVIAVVPGEPFEIGAGYAFGTVDGTLLTMVGIAIGSAIVFALVRTVGVKMAEVFFPIEKIRSLKFIKDSKKLNLITFIVFLIPGTPKDLLSYFMGLTDIQFSYWMFVATFVRIPSVITSAASGDALGLGKYTVAVIFLAATAVISGLGLLYYKRMSAIEKKKAANGIDNDLK